MTTFRHLLPNEHLIAEKPDHARVRFGPYAPSLLQMDRYAFEAGEDPEGVPKPVTSGLGSFGFRCFREKTAR